MRKALATLLVLAMVITPLSAIASTGIAQAAAKLIITSDVDDSSLQPGQTTNVTLTITNVGSSNASGTCVELTSNENITIESGAIDLGTLPGLSFTDKSIPISVSDDCPAGDHFISGELRYRTSLLYSTTVDFEVKVTVLRQPLFDITNVEFSQEVISPGDTFSMYLDIKNEGIGDAKRISVFLGYDVLDVAGVIPDEVLQRIPEDLLPDILLTGERSLRLNRTPFLPDQDLMVYVDEVWAGQEERIEFVLTSDSHAQPGRYMLPIAIFCEDATGRTQRTVENMVGIDMQGPPGSTFIDIVNVRFSEDQIKPGVPFVLHLTLRNLGTTLATNVRAILTSQVTDDSSGITSSVLSMIEDILPEGLLPEELLGTDRGITLIDTPFVPLTDYVVFIDNLEPGEEKEISFPLQTSSTAQPKPYTVPIALLCKDNKGQEQPALNNAIGINLSGAPGSSFVDIVDVVPSSQEIRPGDAFTLSITVKNHGTTTARNTKVIVAYDVSAMDEADESLMDQVTEGLSLEKLIGSTSESTVTDIPFLPVTDFIGFVGTLEPGEEKIIDFDLRSSMLAEAKAYAIPITIIYANNEGEEQPPVKNFAGIQMVGEVNLALAGITTDPEALSPGEAYTLMLRIENLGTQNANSVRVAINGSVDYLGTLGPGEIGVAMFDMQAEEKKDAYSVEVTYSDPEGTPIAQNPIEVVVESPNGEGLNMFYILLALGAILLAILFISLRRRSRRSTE